jgi:hypothetical protein
VPVRTAIRRQMPTTATWAPRGRTVADAEADETRARRELGLALARADQTYALAARRLEEFDDFLRIVHARLRDSGYLSDHGYHWLLAQLSAPHSRSAHFLHVE